MRKPRKPLSELQKSNLLTGQMLFRCYCTTELIKLLEESGYYVAALEVRRALKLGRELAYKEGKEAIAKAKESKNV